MAVGYDDGRAIACALGVESEDRVVWLRAGDGDKVAALAWSLEGSRSAVTTDSGSVAVYDLAK